MNVSKKEKILETAIKIIDEEGFSALSMKRVGELVGITEPAVYRYFKSKENLINEIFTKIISIHKRITEKYSDTEDELLKIEEILTSQLEYYEKNREITAVIFSLDAFSYSPTIKKNITKIMKEREILMVSLIRRAQEKGIIKKIHPNHITKMIAGSIMLLVVSWRTENYSFSLLERGKELIESIKSIIKEEESA